MSLAMEEIHAHLNRLAKPPGSLGRWEELAARLCWIQQSLEPRARPVELVIFAADHGVVDEGVSLWPPMVTTLMCEQIAEGGSVSAALAEAYSIPRRIIDVGTKIPSDKKHENLKVRRIGSGTRNLAIESAMTRDEFEQALLVGREEAQASHERGVRVLIAGEMGIGNTTSASCLAVLLTDLPISQSVGQGAGATAESLQRKRQVVELASHRAKTLLDVSIESAIAEIAGYEIVAMAGCFLQAAKQRQTILLDGVIATAAALIANSLQPGCSDSMIAAHISAEPAHRLMLLQLGLTPMLDWSMRLGEGTGALALFPLLEGAAAWCNKTATIASLAHRLS